MFTGYAGLTTFSTPGNKPVDTWNLHSCSLESNQPFDQFLTQTILNHKNFHTSNTSGKAKKVHLIINH